MAIQERSPDEKAGQLLSITEQTVEPSSRLKKLPVYVFAQLDEMKAAARSRGIQLIDLGMGNPDCPTPTPIIKAILAAVADPKNHGYPNFKGKPEFRQAVADWMSRRYNVAVNPESEVLALIGSKEGLAHLAFAYIDTNDYSLVPTPYYPVHARATWLAGGLVHHLPLRPENRFLPDLSAIPEEIARKAKLIFINYPNNPTGAVADMAFFEELVAFCRKFNIVLVNDLAYAEICFEGYRPPSILSVPGAKSVAIEFHSFTKSFNMAGWRAGFAVGNAQVIKNLHDLKTNVDYGLSPAIQEGAIHALRHGEEFLPEIIQTYQERRDVLIEGFQSLGWPTVKVQGTLYIWLPIPARFKDSQTWCQYLMDTAGVVITPGHAFGEGGEGYFRISLVSPKETLKEAIERLRQHNIRFST